ncbi:MAG: septum formation initiator family protein [Patescibacteria group bacterium]|nr:septum formation initiator family protein [Patescibacteria group bacterium]
MKQVALKTVLIILGIFLVISLARGVWDSYRSGSRLGESESKLAALKNENDKLKKEISFRQSDYFIEKEAREKLNLGKPNETAVALPESNSAKESPKAPLEIQNWRKWSNLFLAGFDL